MSTRTWTTAIGAIAMTVLLGACGSNDLTQGATGLPDADQGLLGSDDEPTVDLPEGCEQTYVVSLCETYDVTGGLTLSGNGTDIASVPNPAADITTCANWAGAADFDAIEFGQPDEGVGGVQFSMYFSVTGYEGPGSYPLGPGNGYINEFQATEGTTGSFEVAADGSGKISFSDLKANGGTETISGTISWVCVESK